MLLGFQKSVALVFRQNICAKHVAFSEPYVQSVVVADFLTKRAADVEPQYLAVGVADAVPKYITFDDADNVAECVPIKFTVPGSKQRAFVFAQLKSKRKSESTSD